MAHPDLKKIVEAAKLLRQAIKLLICPSCGKNTLEQQDIPGCRFKCWSCRREFNQFGELNGRVYDEE